MRNRIYFNREKFYFFLLNRRLNLDFFFSIEWILWSSYYVMASLIELSKDKINSDVSFILNMAIPQSYIHRDRYILGK